MDARSVKKMTTEELEEENRQLDFEGAAIRERRKALVAELNHRAATAAAAKQVASMTPVEKAVTLELLQAEGRQVSPSE